MRLASSATELCVRNACMCMLVIYIGFASFFLCNVSHLLILLLSLLSLLSSARSWCLPTAIALKEAAAKVDASLALVKGTCESVCMRVYVCK